MASYGITLIMMLSSLRCIRDRVCLRVSVLGRGLVPRADPYSLLGLIIDRAVFTPRRSTVPCVVDAYI